LREASPSEQAKAKAAGKKSRDCVAEPR
jgi:hypothetical protein